MNLEPQSETDFILRRFGQTAAQDWQRILAHFSLGKGFALLVLIVPDGDAARLCREELERALHNEGRDLAHFEPAMPADMFPAARAIMERPVSGAVGAVWFCAAVPRSVEDFPAWEKGWRQSLVELNQRRNPLMRHLPCPLVLVGAPWLLPVFREVAPDLWSVRAMVAHIEPERQAAADLRLESLPRSANDLWATRPGTDPEMALREAERLRGLPRLAEARALLLRRAAEGWESRGDLPRAEAALREALDLFDVIGDRSAAGRAAVALGRVLLAAGLPVEAEAAFRRGLEIGPTADESPVVRANLSYGLGLALLDQGRPVEAEATLKHLLTLGGGVGVPPASRPTMAQLGRALLEQGRPEAAESWLRRSLEIDSDGDASVLAPSETIYNLARALLLQGKTEQAEVEVRRALAVAEAAGAPLLWRGAMHTLLGYALQYQGRFAEAKDALRQGFAFNREGSDTAASIARTGVLPDQVAADAPSVAGESASSE